MLSACARSNDGAAIASCEPIADSPASRPLTIPALLQWEPASGTFSLGDGARIVASSAFAPVAQTFAEDLQALTGRALPVLTDGAQSGDIVLAPESCDATLGVEGYRLAIGDRLQIRALTPNGAFYGTRTALQLLHQSPQIARGRARDVPRYPERGMMVDAGRKYFSPAWLALHVRELAYLKMNYLHLHFSDNEGFRIESESHPEIVSADRLSKDEVRSIVALAQRYFITVTPEIDMPGHMAAALGPHPELQLENVLGHKDASRLDVTNPAALPFATELIEEYLALFPGPYWHTGADEYLPPTGYDLHPQLASYAQAQYGSDAVAKDAVHGFTNRVDELVRAHGRTTRMWHDDLNGGAAVTVNPDIVVEWWTNVSPLSDPFPPDPQSILDAGHEIENSGWFPTYYVQGGAFGVSPLPPPADMRSAYESWEVNQFYGPLYYDQSLNFPPDVIDPVEPRNRGAKLNLWSDDPTAETEDKVTAHIAPNLRVIAQKDWGSPLLVPDYASFETIMAAVGGPALDQQRSLMRPAGGRLQSSL
ncbi:MAG TPA: beta-N-acetylhexosaminidase [Nevskiaceae bacterium]|nr:beta-N-acetylhexosaminidase [Nevskiaceae bacterium]